MRMESAAGLCWVVPDLSRYHDARIEAYARVAPGPVTVIELGGRSGFRAFGAARGEPRSYQRRTLPS